MFVDKILDCLDCHQSFTFTAGEQEFYERKGFRETPKRCKDCRENRRQRRGQVAPMGGDEEINGNMRAAGGGGRGGSRELFDATCAACGAVARVPFRPVAGRPVYCRDCYSNRSANQ